MTEDRILARLRACYLSLHTAAHRAEQPLHVVYFSAVFYSSNAAYGYIALLCGVVMLLAWERT